MSKTNERERLRREMRWLDASSRELWWGRSAARRLLVDRIASLREAAEEEEKLVTQEAEAHEAWMRASRSGSDDPEARTRCLAARYHLTELRRRKA